MKQLQKLAAMLTILCLLPVLLPVTASAEVITGKCGEDVFYTLDLDTKTLTITGKGAIDMIPDYEVEDNNATDYIKWESYRTQIKTVIIGEGITSVEEYAFEGFTELTKLELPESLTEIRKQAFYGCKKLREVQLPSQLQRLGDGAFRGCDSLETLTLPKTLTEFHHSSPVRQCKSLTAIYVEDGNPVYTAKDGVLFSKDGRLLVRYPAGKPEENYTVPAGVREIAAYAFSECTALRRVESSGSVKKIGAYAFYGCSSLESVILGSTQRKFEEEPYYAERYYGCSKLNELYYDYDPGYFRDVNENTYYAEPVRWAAKNGITTGTSDVNSTFSPKNACIRADVVTFLWRAVGKPEAIGRTPFTDVDYMQYYYTPVIWALGKNVTTGTSEQSFSPKKTCTRGEIVTFLWRLAGKPEPAGNDPLIAPDNPFTDVDENAYYYKPVLWAVENGVTTGTSPTTFSPNDVCTRAQVVTFLYRAR